MKLRRTNAELEVEFDRLVAQIEAFEVLFGPLASPETAPHVVARRIKATAGLSVAIQGCKVAINDALEIALDAPHEQQALVDARLVKVGAPRLHALLAGRAKSIVAILKRGAVKTDTEFYLLKEALINESAPLSSNRRKRAQLMLTAYEDSLSGAV